MMYQDINLTIELKELWEKGSKEVVVIRYEEGNSAVIRCYMFWTALCNYRQKVRKLKLNPLYKDEWSRIERTKLYRINRTSFFLASKHSIGLANRRKMFEDRLPWNTFNFPVSVINL